MSSLQVKTEPLAVDVSFDEDMMTLRLADGRELSVPLEWFPRLRNANNRQLKRWELIGKGIGIHWKDLDEDISVEGLLR